MDKAWYAPFAPEALAEYLEGTGIRWRVTGMYMFNEFLGRQLREPHDLDVEIIREDAPRLPTAMPSWQHYYVDAGARLHYRGQTLPDDVRRVVSRPGRSEPWAMDWLLCYVDGDEWVYRYDSRVRQPLDDSFDADSSRINFAPPEVALLYKSRMARPKDFDDFAVLHPHLDAHRRAWLADAIALADPEHPWLGALRKHDNLGLAER
jgi:hypothetical protein